MAHAAKTKATAAGSPQPAPLDNVRERATRAASVTLDVPIGSAVVATERAGELAKTGRATAKTELGRLGSQVRTELNEAERRGSAARRHAMTRARQTGRGFERNLSDRRERIELAIREKRSRATHRLRDAEVTVRRNREAVEQGTRDAVGRVRSLI